MWWMLMWDNICIIINFFEQEQVQIEIDWLIDWLIEGISTRKLCTFSYF